MNKQFYSGILLIGLISLVSSCMPEKLHGYQGLLDYMGRHETVFTQTWQSEDINVTCTVRPPALLAAQDIELRRTAGNASLDSLIKAYRQQVYFTLRFSRNNKEFENRFLNDRPAYLALIRYFNSGIANDLFLVNSDNQKIKAISVAYPRMYGNTGSTSVLVVFPGRLPEAGECSLLLEGGSLGLPPLTFTFNAKALHNIPELIL